MTTDMERIAQALERQCAQHDESVERSMRREREGIERHDREVSRVAREHQENIALAEHGQRQLDEALSSIKLMRAIVNELHQRLLILEAKT